MPDHIIRYGKYTETFTRRARSPLKFVPSLRPPVHILIDSKANVSQYDLVTLAAWTQKRDDRIVKDFSHEYIENNIPIGRHKGFIK